jgi:phosphate transport system substrate-binding protein
LAFLCGALLLSACEPWWLPAGGAPGLVNEPGGRISVAGSTTVQPLAEKLAEAFRAAHPEAQVEIDVMGGGSSVGVTSAGQRSVDVGMSSRELKEGERAQYPDLRAVTIALDGIAVVVHPSTRVANLTTAQLRGVFAGQVADWQTLGGAAGSVFPVSREEGSGTRSAFEDMVMGKERITGRAIFMPSNGSIRTTVGHTPGAIGYLSFGYVDETVRAVAADGVAPTEANAASGAYPVVRPLILLTNGQPPPRVQAWLDFILGADGQRLVAGEGYIPISR